MVYIILGNGFEETEALAPCDILRRGGVEVSLAGIGGNEITGGHGITVKTDCTVEEIDMENAEMVVFPGGSTGVVSIAASETAMNTMKAAQEKGIFTAAICAGPTLLAKLGITDGKKAVCYPGRETEMGSAVMEDAKVVRDGKIITAKAAGESIDFGLALLEALRGKEIADEVAASVCY